jgi:hypothetical protein
MFQDFIVINPKATENILIAAILNCMKDYSKKNYIFLQDLLP